jgi:hypothetical protein
MHCFELSALVLHPITADCLEINCVAFTGNNRKIKIAPLHIGKLHLSRTLIKHMILVDKYFRLIKCGECCSIIESTENKTFITFCFRYAEISGKLLKTCLPCRKTGNLPFGVQKGLLVTHVCKGTPENFAYVCKTRECKYACILT